MQCFTKRFLFFSPSAYLVIQWKWQLLCWHQINSPFAASNHMEYFEDRYSPCCVTVLSPQERDLQRPLQVRLHSSPFADQCWPCDPYKKLHLLEHTPKTRYVEVVKQLHLCMRYRQNVSTLICEHILGGDNWLQHKVSFLGKDLAEKLECLLSKFTDDMKLQV